MKACTITTKLYDYILDISLREHPVLTAIREDIETKGLEPMQVTPEQAQFLQFFIKAINAQNILEIGTFTGYSALAMALALPENGKIITCDNNREWTKDTLKFWQEAEQAHKIELRLAPALNTLNELLQDGLQQHFDFIFIDADKTNYVNYYELALQLIKPNGIIAIDNVLWHGKVIDEQETDGQTREIRRINQILKQDERVDTSLLPIADGLFLVKLKQ